MRKVPTPNHSLTRNLQRQATKYFDGTCRTFLKKVEDVTCDDPDLDASVYVMTGESYMIPVFLHNLKGYDVHIIMQYIIREYAPSSIDVIPTSEQFFSFQIGNLRFLDSLQFLTASLDVLVKNLIMTSFSIRRGITPTLISSFQRVFAL